MRVALIGPTHPFRGGISHHTTLLAQEISKKHTLKFVSFSRQYPKILFPGKSDKDPSLKPLTVEDVDYVIDSINPLTLLRAGRILRRFNPDIVIFPWWVTFWAIHFWFIARYLKKYTHTKIIFLCHNVVEHEANFLKVLATKLVLRQAGQIFTQSATETEKLKVLFGEDLAVKTAFHPTYAELKKNHISRQQAFEQLGISGRVLLFFGFVRPYKGLDVLLKAMPSILSEQQVTLLVVGEFWKDRNKYVQLIDELHIESSVKVFDQYIPNEQISLFFAAADLVVQPYKSVTGSGVCQLAYGLNTPVIATNIGSLNEVVDDGVNGRLIVPDNPEALAQAVLESLQPEVLVSLTENAKSSKEKYSWERFASLLCKEG